MKCSMRSMPMKIASRGLTELRAAGIEMAGHGQAVAMRLLDQREQLRRGWMPLALKPRAPRAAQSSTSLRIRSGVHVGVRQPGRAVPKYGPELRMRGPICSPRSMRRRAPIMPSGSTSPAGNVDVTPLARKTIGLTVYSSTRPAPNRSIA